MKFFLAWLICSVGAMSALAQGVSMELVLDQDTYLASEILLVKVRITNFSGQTLQFGKDDDWLKFTIEGTGNLPVPKKGLVPVKGEFALESSTVGTKGVDITPWFDLSRPGAYTVTATLRVAGWQQTVTSNPKKFSIVAGSKQWEQD